MIYILYGKDKFRKQILINKLKEEHIEAGMESMNFVQAENPDIDTLAAIVATPGWGFSKKIVVIKDLVYLEKASDDDVVTKLEAIFGNIDENLILIIDNEKVLKTIKMYKRLAKIATAEDYNEFSSWDFDKAAQWVCSLEFDFKISINAAKFLVERIGAEDSSNIYNELIRLGTLSDEITDELIAKECKEKNTAFSLAEALAKGDKTKALKGLHSLSETKDIHLGTLSLLETIVTRYHKVKLAQKERIDEKALAAKMGMSPGRLYYLKRDAGKMQFEHLENLLTNILETEKTIKTGKMPLENAFKKLILA